eukprot:m.1468607 g.1468607  ORF g.1468607 m.1468607 type:complete len:150 (+) comp25139_c0_seq25:141-590(+)
MPSSDTGATWPVSLLQIVAQLAPSSPLELQINGDPNNVSVGTWIPISLQAQCAKRGTACSINMTTGKKLPEASTAFAPLNSAIPVANITGLRYAFGDNPCCPSFNRNVVPCPPNSCPIQTYNTSLPAVPFWATIKNGTCAWISTQGPAA